MTEGRVEDGMTNVPLSSDDSEGEVPGGVWKQGSTDAVGTSTGTNSTTSLCDETSDEAEEKARLICQTDCVIAYSNVNVCSLDLSQRVDAVKEENLKLKSENQVLGQYIENLMSASSVFQTTSPKSKKK
ncbi:short coiled-coil protein B-like [Branchiostoma floridae]|uniref:Short coiled-coil protein B-like n=1 Tax=Branchiostoma floridae TaxID=7739 RepID=A0A9J7LGW4_BRAFL|nr:short coiled-coil protein B-like [Branchiostoma floridae]